MLGNVISNLKKILPDAFVDKKPSIPWLSEKTKTVSLREMEFPDFREFPIFPPPIFVYPEAEVPSADDELDGEVREGGVEALAWYVPFHQSKNWGINTCKLDLFY